LPNSYRNDSAMMRGTINIDDTIDDRRKGWSRQRLRECRWFERRCRLSCVVLYLRYSLGFPIKRFLVAHSTLPRRQRMKRPRISLRFSMADNDGDDNNDNGDKLPSRRYGLTTFFLLLVRDVHPLCLLEWKLDPLSFPFLCLYLSGAGLNESTTFMSGVSRFRLKSPFHSELYLAVISRSCQTTFPELFRVELSSRLVRVPKTFGYFSWLRKKFQFRKIELLLYRHKADTRLYIANVLKLDIIILSCIETIRMAYGLKT